VFPATAHRTAIREDGYRLRDAPRLVEAQVFVAEGPFLKVVPVEDHGEHNAVGIDDMQAIVTNPLDAPRRRAG
jgi:hypothetical protein